MEVVMHPQFLCIMWTGVAHAQDLDLARFFHHGVFPGLLTFENAVYLEVSHDHPNGCAGLGLHQDMDEPQLLIALLGGGALVLLLEGESHLFCGHPRGLDGDPQDISAHLLVADHDHHHPLGDAKLLPYPHDSMPILSHLHDGDPLLVLLAGVLPCRNLLAGVQLSLDPLGDVQTPPLLEDVQHH